MASIIDEFKVYLNTPKKVVMFRFGVSVVFFLLGLSMVTRVRRLCGRQESFLRYDNHSGWSLRSEYRRSIPRWLSLADHRRCRVILHCMDLRYEKDQTTITSQSASFGSIRNG
jgi:hypothetical protein